MKQLGLSAFLLLCVFQASGQTVFTENFNRAALATGAPTTYTTTLLPTGADGGASIITSTYLQLTNDASATANVAQRIGVTGTTSSYSAPYNTTLSSNTNVVTWTFNMKYNRTSLPSGWANNAYGMGVVLASSNSNPFATSSNSGYAVVFGNTGAVKSLRLVSFNNGLVGDANLTNVISTGLNDLGATATGSPGFTNYFSVRVTYTPSTNTWALFLRDDGNTAWSDPSTGVTTQLGANTVNSTYTGVALSTFGYVYNYSTAANTTSQVDNFSVALASAAVPSIAISNTTVGNSTENVGTNDVVLQQINLAVTTSNATLNGLTVTTAGTYVAADLTNLKVRYSADATLDGADATLSTKTTALGAGSHVFPTFTTQLINSGSTGYIFITADIAGAATSGNTINLATTAFSNISFVSGTKTGTDPVAIGGTKTFSVTTPDVTISNGTIGSSNQALGTTNVVLQRYDLSVATASATLNGLTITTSGSYVAADLSNLKVRYSTDNILDGADATLSTKTTGLGLGSQVFPTFSTQTISSGSTGYLFITADIAASATPGNSINVATTAFTNISFISANKLGTNPVAAGGTITFIAPLATQPVIAEIYGGGGNTGASYTHDYIILFNPTASCFDLSTYSIQYGSSGSSAPTVKGNLTGSIPAGGYYLIKGASNAAIGSALPDFNIDLSASLALGNGAGKVILVNNQTLQANYSNAAIVDFVGYGAGTTSYEGAGPTASPSNTSSVRRKSNTGTSTFGVANAFDSNNNAADFYLESNIITNAPINNPNIPTATAATSILAFTMNANWGAVTAATSYVIDVSTSNTFASFVGSYNNFSVGNVTTYNLTGLSETTQYYYRVRAVKSGRQSCNSNTISATTLSSINTAIDLTSISSTVNENVGTVTLTFTINNPSVTLPTTFDLALTGGAGIDADVNNYTTQTVTFPANSSANQTLVITVSDDLLAESTESLIFTMQNFTGGSGVPYSSNGTYTLTITDNEPAIVIGTQLSSIAGTIGAPSQRDIIFQTSISASISTATLTGVSFQTAGTYQTSDLSVGTFKLWINTGSTNFYESTQIGSASNAVASGGTLTFSGLSAAIPSGTSARLWLTCDVAPAAVSGRTISIATTPFSNFTFATTGGVSGSPNPIVASATQTILTRPVVTELILPQYIQGKTTSSNNTRVPYVYQARITGLTPNATYRYYNLVALSTDADNADGAGNVILTTGANFSFTSSPNLTSSYGQLTADATGAYTGWFATEPTGNVRFTAGNDLYFRIILNNGSNGTAVTHRITTTNSAKVVDFAAVNVNDRCTGIRGTSTGTAKNLVMLYDNVAGSGRPVAGTYIENDGTPIANYAGYFSTVNGIDGSWGTIIPNNLTNG
ncbi:MAG TPA: hypothetical protein PL185_08735, partial [Flavobacteriales bacterium]|nr:hypothetical protein [Flavobacteriales bacterium]